MIIGERLRELRRQKNFTQGEVESRTGLLRCYISRVEHGHTVPSVVTLEKFARALEVPIYQLFYDGENPPPAQSLAKRKIGDETGGWTRACLRSVFRCRVFGYSKVERS